MVFTDNEVENILKTTLFHFQTFTVYMSISGGGGGSDIQDVSGCNGVFLISG